jgi:hypothetical protein
MSKDQGEWKEKQVEEWWGPDNGYIGFYLE